MNKKRFVGFVLVLTGILLSLSRIAFTGAVIGAQKTALLDFTTATITIVGIFMILSSEAESGLERRTQKLIREIDQTLREGGVGSSDDLEHYARQLGLTIDKKTASSHARVIGPRGYVTTIPLHGKDIGKGIYRKILRQIRDYAAA